MKLRMWVCAVILATGVWDVHAQQVSPEIRIGVVAFAREAADAANFNDPFNRGLAEIRNSVAISFTAFSGGPDVAASRIRELIEKDRKNLIVLSGVPLALVLQEAQRFTDTAFLHTDMTAIGLPSNLSATRNVVTYGSIPSAQRQFLIANVTKAQSVLVGSVFQPAIVDSLSNIVQRESGVATVKLLFDPRTEGIGTFAARIAQTRPPTAAGIVGEAEADELAFGLRGSNYENPLVLFSPPPLQTRAFLAGRLISMAIQGRARQPSDVLDRIRAIPRFSSEPIQSIGLPWSIRFSNLDSNIVARVGPPAFYGPDRNGSDNTQECSCRNQGGTQVSCKNCEPNKCVKTNDGRDDCSTKCNAQ
jgi:hypothetical protein